MINFCKPMHYVSKIDYTQATTPKAYVGHSTGFSRAGYVDRGMGSVHMGAGICSLAPGGFVERHMHSFEESFYILEGNVRLEANQRQELGPGNFGLLRTGTPHAWSNTGHGPVR
jgi:quercetin dioxygenase-like cupin family protein